MFVLLLSGITNAQTFDFSCGITAEELIIERLAELNAIADEATYTHVEGAYHNEQETAYGFRVIRTTSDGSEIDYFGDAGQGYGIPKTNLGSEDTSGPAGWDKYLADAKQAVVDSEIDGVAAALAMTAEELASLTASRTLELKAKGSATTSVTIRWDGGHIITVDGNDILARDHGHNNYGKSTQDQFDALLKVVEDAVIAADATANLSLGNSRKQQLEDLSRDGVFVSVDVTGGNLYNGYFITFKREDGTTFNDNDGDPLTFGGDTKLQDLTDFETSLYKNTENRVSNIINSITSYFVITESELNGHAITATTEDVLVTPEMGDTNGVPFVQVVFSDKSGHLNYTGTSKYSNGGKLPTEGTEDEFDIWVDSWTLAIADYQRYIDEAKAITKRADFISQLETAFIAEATSTVTITLIKDNNNDDAILFSEIGGSVSFDSKFSDLLENLEQPTITTAIDALAGNVAFLQILINQAYAEKTADLNDKINSFGQSDQMDNFIATVEEIDDAINHTTNPGAAIKSLFTDLLGKTTSTGDVITGVLANTTGTTNGVTYRLINIFTDAGWFDVRGPAGIPGFDSMNGNQVKEFYLAVVEQAWYQTNLN